MLRELALEDFEHRASRVFDHGSGEYHFIEISLVGGLCCDSPDMLCVIRSPEEEVAIFSASLSDQERIAALVSAVCPPGPTAGPMCDFPGMESPLVESIEFARWADLDGTGFMGWCRARMAEAQARGDIPSPDDLAAPRSERAEAPIGGSTPACAPQ